jgi:hypothetical protein
MPQPWHPRHGYQDAHAKECVGRLAGRQFGRIASAQLRALELPRQRVFDWVRTGYLYPELPGIFAVGHPARSDESNLFAAVLYAGPGAALAGLTAALWRGLVKWHTAPAIEVATPRRIRSLPASDPNNRLGTAIEVRGRRPIERHTYHGIPTVPIAAIMLELAASGDVELVRFALAQLDYDRTLDIGALEALCGRGVPGSTALRRAIGRPQPRFARARSPFEVRLIQVCERTGIPLPAVNEKVGGLTVDAFWRDELVVVECDGELNHGTWRQRKRDLRRDQTLRRLGALPIRYTYDQLDDPVAIHADLMPILEQRRSSPL